MNDPFENRIDKDGGGGGGGGGGEEGLSLLAPLVLIQMLALQCLDYFFKCFMSLNTNIYQHDSQNSVLKHIIQVTKTFCTRKLVVYRIRRQ